MSSLFCRHNRFTADCSICSKGTVLDSSRAGERTRPRRSGSGGSRGGAGKGATSRAFSGPHVSAGPYERESDSPSGERYEVRLEKVPGGIRLAQWSGGALERRAPELPAADLAGLVAAATEKELLDARDAERLAAAVATPAGETGDHGASAGRAGDLREELRVERIPHEGTEPGDGRLRVGRWLFWPGRGWELQEAPPMFPATRYAEALREAAARGLLTAAAREPAG